MPEILAALERGETRSDMKAMDVILRAQKNGPHHGPRPSPISVSLKLFHLASYPSQKTQALGLRRGVHVVERVVAHPGV
jgi:hypothetical protein